jgi:spheroidene monooxygenase
VAVTTISFFRFEGFWNRVWAFVHVQLAKGPLRRSRGVRFAKVMGTGHGRGFDLWPNFSVYAVLVTWSSLEEARQGFADTPMLDRYRRRSVEQWTVFLGARRSVGSWDRRTPFEAARPQAREGPVGILTRASIRWRHVVAFWRSVPAVSRATAQQAGLCFQMGMGELPVFSLTTFSVWDGQHPMRCFAYHPGPHRDTMVRARQDGWFKEDLFARFEILASVGTWEGRDPLQGLLTAPAEAPVPASVLKEHRV